MQAEFESVIELVLQQMELFRADLTFMDIVDKIGSNRMDSDTERGLERAWLIQKLSIFKKIVVICSDDELSKMLDRISFNNNSMSIVYDLLKKCFVMFRDDGRICNGDAWDDFWDKWGYDAAFVEEVFDSMKIEAGTLSQCVATDQLNQAYDQAFLIHEKELKEELEQNADADFDAIKKERKEAFFAMITEYLLNIEKAGLKKTPYDSLEYILVKDMLDEWLAYGNVWWENEVFKDYFLPSVEHNLEKRKESWCKQLYEKLTRIGGFCNSLYLPENAYLNEDVWYFPMFMCCELDNESEFEITLHEFNVDEMFRIMSLTVLCRYLVRVGVLKLEPSEITVN